MPHHLALFEKLRIHASCFIAQHTDLIGDVELNEGVNVWPMAVLRADINSIKVGRYTNIQDGTIIHVDDHFPTLIGEWVTVGHRCVLHGCSIENCSLIGMGSIVLDGAHIGEECLIGANTLITKGTQIPPGALVLGSPGKVIRMLTESEKAGLKASAERYVKLAEAYRMQTQP